jgi:thiol-disulfide isomerase/thioredoxin
MNMFRLLILILISSTLQRQDVKVIKFPELETILNSDSHEILVVNFWATWCGPCVKELPLFEQLHNQDESTHVVLVSLDFADKIARVKSFISRKKLRSRVILLDEIDYNSWIDKVDERWAGAIPATLIINTRTGKRKFVEKELEEGELERLINDIKKT